MDYDGTENIRKFKYPPFTKADMVFVGEQWCAMSVVTDDDLKRELLEMDVRLRRQQVWWETPRNAAILAGAVIGISGAVAGLLGYKVGYNIGSAPTAPPIIIQMPAQK